MVRSTRIWLNCLGRSHRYDCRLSANIDQRAKTRLVAAPLLQFPIAWRAKILRVAEDYVPERVFLPFTLNPISPTMKGLAFLLWRVGTTI